MKVILHLLGYKGYYALRHLLMHSDFRELQIEIGQDKQVDNDFSKEIESLCSQYGIPAAYRKQDSEGLRGDYHIAIGWRWMIRGVEDDRLIVFHDSILPRYRGFNPLVTALINGDSEIGVTALFGGDTFDSGPIIDQYVIEVDHPIKIAQAIDRLSVGYAELLQQVIGQLAQGLPLNAEPQDETVSSYSVWRDAEDYHIDWSKGLEEICRFVDAVGEPYAGALSFVDDIPVRILDVSVQERARVENPGYGKVIFKVDDKPVVVCGDGLLRIDRWKIDGQMNNELPRHLRYRFK